MMTMPSTIPFKRGDIVLVPFPFTDLTDVRQRPAVVISNDSYNDSHADVVTSAITSQVPQNLAPDELLIAEDDLSTAGLPRRSMIRAGKIFAIDKSLVRKSLGTLPVGI